MKTDIPTPNIVKLASTSEPKSEIAAGVEEMERDMVYLEKHYHQRAHLYRVFYTQLLARGFTESDALYLTEAEFSD